MLLIDDSYKMDRNHPKSSLDDPAILSHYDLVADALLCSVQTLVILTFWKYLRLQLSSPEGRKATGHVTGRGEGRNRTHARAGPEWEESPDRTNRLWGWFVRAGAALMAGRRGAPLLHMAVCGVAQAP